jgi:pilus assembly protein Flp/PilA
MPLPENWPVGAACRPIGRHVGRSARFLCPFARCRAGPLSPKVSVWAAWCRPALKGGRGQDGRSTARPRTERLSMLSFFVSLQNFLAQPLRRDDRGASAVEYGLLVFLIAIVIVAAVTTLGTKLASVFSTVTADL